MDWRRLFPDSDFKFPMGLRPGNFQSFFAAENKSAHPILRERMRWIESTDSNDRADYVRAEETSRDAMRELATCIKTENHFYRPEWDVRGITIALHRGYEPDWVLLSQDSNGVYHAVAGAVCFPSGWSLAEKMGKPIDEIHAIVPGLNDTMGRQIDSFLSRLAPETAWERENWGLSADDALNHHPSRNVKKLDSTATLDTTWIRVERQLFFKLPQTGAIVFGIRVSSHRLREVCTDREVADRVVRALETMPDDVAMYKGIAEARGPLVQQLRQGAHKS